MPNESTPPIKSEDFWFEDGDIILSVTEDGVESHFCVHRSILTIASPVFRDMLSMPQAPECKNQLVRLIDDSVKDLKALLGALYCSRWVGKEAHVKVFTNICKAKCRYCHLT